MREAARQLVCAADEVWRLQRGADADCLFFQRMVNGGERITDRGSRQGLWICAPGGTVLARCNTRDPERVLATIEAGLAAWAELPPEARRVPRDVQLEPEHRWEHGYPEGGLVLERLAREVGEGGLEAEPHPAWNRDYAWLSRSEVAALGLADAEPGQRIELPLLARRLARFHLVDNARGQTLPYADEEIEEASLVARVLARDGARLTLELSGATLADAGRSWLLGENLWTPRRGFARGIACQLLGRAVFDADTGAFAELELVALARRWGRTQFNGRGRDDAPGRLAFWLGLAPPSPRIAPAFVAVYDVDWIEAPSVGTWMHSPEECEVER